MLAVGLFSRDRSNRRRGILNESLVKTDIFFLAIGRAIITYLLKRKKAKNICTNSSALDQYWSDSSALESASDQIFQTEVTFDHTFQTEGTSDYTFQTKLTSDHT